MVQAVFSGDPTTDAENLRTYVRELAFAFEADTLILPDADYLRGLFLFLYGDFPYVGGFAHASVFKQAGAFASLIAQLKPFRCTAADNLENARLFSEIVAFTYPLRALHGAHGIFFQRPKCGAGAGVAFLLDKIRPTDSARLG